MAQLVLCLELREANMLQCTSISTMNVLTFLLFADIHSIRLYIDAQVCPQAQLDLSFNEKKCICIENEFRQRALQYMNVLTSNHTIQKLSNY